MPDRARRLPRRRVLAEEDDLRRGQRSSTSRPRATRRSVPCSTRRRWRQLRDADALVEVVRGFPDLTGGAADARSRTSTNFDSELVLADLAQVEKRLERLKKEKGKEREQALLERCQEHLEAEQPLRTLDLTPEERARSPASRSCRSRPLLRRAERPRGGRRGAAPGRGRRPCARRAARERDGALGADRDGDRASSTPATGRRSSPTSASPRARATASSAPPTSCST